jgi:hypothetical protein
MRNHRVICCMRISSCLTVQDRAEELPELGSRVLDPIEAHRSNKFPTFSFNSDSLSGRLVLATGVVGVFGGASDMIRVRS